MWEQEAERRFDIFSVNAPVFLVNHTAAVIRYAEKHQGGSGAVGPQPGRFFDLFQVRGTEIELPAIIAVLSLKPHGGGLAAPGFLVITPLAQIAIDSTPFQQTWLGLDKTIRCLDSELLQKPNGLARG